MKLEKLDVFPMKVTVWVQDSVELTSLEDFIEEHNTGDGEEEEQAKVTKTEIKAMGKKRQERDEEEEKDQEGPAAETTEGAQLGQMERDVLHVLKTEKQCTVGKIRKHTNLETQDVERVLSKLIEKELAKKCDYGKVVTYRIKGGG
jgi:DNA-binding MarR family transcriptional regulator